MTVSSGVAFLVSFVAVLVSGPWVIERLRVLKFGQNINPDVPAHAKKQGTPTMGGIMLLIAVPIGLIAAIFADGLHAFGISPAPAVAVLLVFVGHVANGGLDD